MLDALAARMILITRLVTLAAAVFALATLSPAQEPTDLGKGVTGAKDQ
jgi:hypothetical protein